MAEVMGCGQVLLVKRAPREKERSHAKVNWCLWFRKSEVFSTKVNVG